MKIERTVITDDSETIALERTIAYLVHAGYKQITSEPVLTFQRGWVFGSWISFTPKGWRAKATIKVIPDDSQTKVVAVFEINTVGQLVTDKERAFWDAEANGLEAAFCNSKVRLVANSKLARSVVL